MFGIDFSAFSVWINFALFAAASGIVWFAGGQVAHLADTISDKTGLGSAFVGVLFLAVATSSPEIATTLTAAFRDEPTLAVNNLLGSIIFQTTILAIVDAILVRGALTAFTPKPVLMLQGVLLILLLSLTLAGAISGLSPSLWGIGLWPMLIFVVYVVVLYLVEKYEGNERWQVIPDVQDQDEREKMQREERENQERSEKAIGASQGYQEWSVRRLAIFFAGGTLAILVAGAFLATIGETLAEQTGLGTGFVGVTLLAVATALPEVSSTITAAQIGRLEMAVSNIFGSNAFMLALLVVADLAYRSGQIVAAIDRATMFAAAAGILVTAVYLAGLIERRDITIFRMGIDSAAVMVIYLGSLVILYFIR